MPTGFLLTPGQAYALGKVMGLGLEIMRLQVRARTVSLFELRQAEEAVHEFRKAIHAEEAAHADPAPTDDPS